MLEQAEMSANTFCRKSQRRFLTMLAYVIKGDGLKVRTREDEEYASEDVDEENPGWLSGRSWETFSEANCSLPW